MARSGMKRTAADFRQPNTALRVVQGLEDYCERHGVADINELVGGVLTQ